MTAYLEPTREAAVRLIRRGLTGPLVNLNLIRLRPVADYAACPELAPPAPISGAEAFDLYIRHTLPFLREAGGEVTFLGRGGPWLIGPAAEHWDLAMLVRQREVESFLGFETHAAYRAGLGHRTAAVADARLLPLSEMALPD